MKKLATKAAFDEFLSQNQDSSVIVLFHASWVPPSRKMAQVFDKMSIEFTDVHFALVDIDENEETTLAHQIEVMPTFQFYKAGIMVDELKGGTEMSLHEFIEKLK